MNTTSERCGALLFKSFSMSFSKLMKTTLPFDIQQRQQAYRPPSSNLKQDAYVRNFYQAGYCLYLQWHVSSTLHPHDQSPVHNSPIRLYDTTHSASAASHNWQKKASFLHFLKKSCHTCSLLSQADDTSSFPIHVYLMLLND